MTPPQTADSKWASASRQEALPDYQELKQPSIQDNCSQGSKLRRVVWKGGPRKESSTNSFLSQLELIKQEEDISASVMFIEPQEECQTRTSVDPELLLLVDDALKDPHFMKHVSKNQR